MKHSTILRAIPSSLPLFTAVVAVASFLLCTSLVAQQPEPPAQAQTTTETTAAPAAAEAAPQMPPDQLDSLVAPIALYPDPLLAQTLAASTYPLEIIQLQQWMTKNPNLKDKALADAVAKQPWDPSVQSMAAFPAVVKQLADNVAWTTDLGNAFLAQQTDVMDAVQRMRAKAQGSGNLKASTEQKVQTETVNNKEVIVIEPANPEVVSVPQYSSEAVYGAPAYPYPYTSPPGYGLLAFGTSVAIGAAWGGYWGDCNWNGNGDVTINNNNNFNKNNVNNINKGQGQGGKWQHNQAHRGGAPYSDKRTADKYGGKARGAGGAGGVGGAGKPGGAGGVGGAGKPGGAGGVGGVGGAGKPGGAGGAGGVGGAGKPGGAGGAGKPGGAGGGAKPASKPAGSNSVGKHQPSKGGGGGNAFGGGSGSSAKAASSRGGASMGGGGHGGGGGRSGGGGGGGGGRGGGGGGGGGRRR